MSEGCLIVEVMNYPVDGVVGDGVAWLIAVDANCGRR